MADTRAEIQALVRAEVMAVVNEIIASFRRQQPLSRTDLEALIKAVIPECYHDAPSGYGGYLRFQNGFMEYTNDAAGGSGLDLALCAFGYQINPDGNHTNVVRIYAGEVDRHAVAETDVEVENDDYVYIRRTISDDTLVVLAGASVPDDSATYLYYKLYQFSVSNFVATIQKIWRPFGIEANNIPPIPDTVNDYVLMSVAGVIQWVQTEEFACPI